MAERASAQKVSELVNFAEAYQLIKSQILRNTKKKSFQFQFKTNKPSTDEKSRVS